MITSTSSPMLREIRTMLVVHVHAHCRVGRQIGGVCPNLPLISSSYPQTALILLSIVCNMKWVDWLQKVGERGRERERKKDTQTHTCWASPISSSFHRLYLRAVSDVMVVTTVEAFHEHLVQPAMESTDRRQFANDTYCNKSTFRKQVKKCTQRTMIPCNFTLHLYATETRHIKKCKHK